MWPSVDEDAYTHEPTKALERMGDLYVQVHLDEDATHSMPIHLVQTSSKLQGRKYTYVFLRLDLSHLVLSCQHMWQVCY